MSNKNSYAIIVGCGRLGTFLARSLSERGDSVGVIGRDEEIRRVMQVLTRRTKNNPVLIGEPGVGKTAIAEGLAHQAKIADVRRDIGVVGLLALLIQHRARPIVCGRQREHVADETAAAVAADV